MIKFTCPECRHIFNAHTAYCQDRMDPNKSLGCPECHTFFRKKFSLMAFLFQLLSVLGWVFLITGCMDVWLFQHQEETGYLKIAVGIVVMAIWGVLYGAGKRPKNIRAVQLTKIDEA